MTMTTGQRTKNNVAEICLNGGVKSERLGEGSAHRYQKESLRLYLRRLPRSQRESRALGRGGPLWSGVVVSSISCRVLLHVPRNVYCAHHFRYLEKRNQTSSGGVGVSTVQLTLVCSCCCVACIRAGQPRGSTALVQLVPPVKAARDDSFDSLLAFPPMTRSIKALNRRWLLLTLNQDPC